MKITPMHFLSLNPKVGLPATVNDHKDVPDYNNNLSISQKLLRIWKKGQRHLQPIWEVWKSDYLLNLREHIQIYNKYTRLQSSQEPKVGDIIQVKGNFPRGTCRVGCITKLIKSQDQLERVAKVQLSTRNKIQQSIYHLLPLECNISDTRYSSCPTTSGHS